MKSFGWNGLDLSGRVVWVSGASPNNLSKAYELSQSWSIKLENLPLYWIDYSAEKQQNCRRRLEKLGRCK